MVSIGMNSEVGSHVTMAGPVTLGCDNFVGQGACLGVSMDAKSSPRDSGPVVIGDRNSIREFVCICAGPSSSQATTMGDDNFIMACCHLGAGCHIGHHLVLANGAAVGAMVEIGDGVTISGLVRIEDAVRIGRLAMVGGVSHLDRNVPPFTVVTGHPAEPRCLNYTGLKRSGLTALDSGDALRELKRVWRHAHRWGTVAGHAAHAGDLSGLAAEFLSFEATGCGAANSDPR
jgi:UDP-N-acetylglucosamine acyltransferase